MLSDSLRERMLASGIDPVMVDKFVRESEALAERKAAVRPGSRCPDGFPYARWIAPKFSGVIAASVGAAVNAGDTVSYVTGVGTAAERVQRRTVLAVYSVRKDGTKVVVLAKADNTDE